MSQISRALITYGPAGNGVIDDPCRTVQYVHNAKTLEVLFEYDDYQIEKDRQDAISWRDYLEQVSKEGSRA